MINPVGKSVIYQANMPVSPYVQPFGGGAIPA